MSRLSVVGMGVIAVLLLAGCGGTDRTAGEGETVRGRSVARAPEPVAALPAVTSEDGPLSIDLVYPRPGARRPAADSTFLFGTVGTGRAELVINGTTVPLAPNGAFLAYLPVADAYRLQATAGSRTVADTFRYGQQLTPADARPLSPPRTATVISVRAVRA